MEQRIDYLISYCENIVSSEGETDIGVDDVILDMIANNYRFKGIANEEVVKLCESLCKGKTKQVLFLYSLILDLVKCDYCFNKNAEYAFTNRNKLNIEEQYFLYSQIIARGFRDNYVLPDCYSTWLLEMSSWYVDCFKDILQPIKYTGRNKNLIIVITSQFLDRGHAPSDIALNICKNIMDLKKNVILINIADLLSMTGSFQYLCISPNYLEKYSDMEYIEYAGTQIPFFQCNQGMPNMEMLEFLIIEIRRIKPEIIISVGEDIFSNIIDDMIPCCSIPMSNQLSRNFTKYLVHYNDLTNEDYRWASSYGYVMENLIQTDLPFRVEDSIGITRSDIGVSEDDFCIALIGNRLEAELTEDFKQCLERLINSYPSIRFIVVGKIENKDLLPGEFICIGYTKKLMAICRIIDVFLNPPRQGGGISAVYALSVGKPVISLKYGDVYKNCGEEFGVDDFDEMYNLIVRYMEDENFYKKMSRLAIKKAESYINSYDSIQKLVSILETREAQE